MNDYVQVSSSSSLNLTNAITIMGWIKNNGLGVRKFWSSKANGASNADSEWWMEWQVDNRLSFSLWNSFSSRATISTDDSYNGNWHHIVGTYDKNLSSNNLKIYIDGVLKKGGNQTGQIQISANQPVVIGTIGAWKTNTFNGLIDEVRIYNRALSADEIKALYEATR